MDNEIERLRENLADFDEKLSKILVNRVLESFRWTGFMSRPGTDFLEFLKSFSQNPPSFPATALLILSTKTVFPQGPPKASDAPAKFNYVACKSPSFWACPFSLIVSYFCLDVVAICFWPRRYSHYTSRICMEIF